MGWLKDFREGMAAARRGEPDLSQLTPEQRARYDANMAQVAAAQAEAQASWEDAAGISEKAKAARILHGPAADQLYGKSDMGPSPEELERIRAEQGMRAMIAAARAPQKGEFAKALRQTFDRDGPPEEEDPDQRARIAAEERARRDAARAPYRAPEPPPVQISRLATRGRSQLQELRAFLRQSGLAGRPERVYGVYRVPDRISPTLTPHSEAGRVVEWDVVHEPGALPEAAGDVTGASFEADGQWLARRLGEPSVLDEELGLLYCAWAGVGPEACLGIARVPAFAAAGWTAQESPPLVGFVEAVVALHAPAPGADGMRERMAASAPLQVTAEQLRLAHVEVLEWAEIARVVHPQAHKAWRIPSPVPYLPSTPQELLRAYLEVVGVRAADCWSAQVTIDRPRELFGKVGMGGTNMGPKLPCADGEARGRLHGAQQVVVAYRDSADYAAGRERWSAYQRDVLQARLDGATGRRPPLHVADDWFVKSPVLRAGLGALSAVDRITTAIDRLGADDPPPPYRYCWPPAEP